MKDGVSRLCAFLQLLALPALAAQAVTQPSSPAPTRGAPPWVEVDYGEIVESVREHFPCAQTTRTGRVSIPPVLSEAGGWFVEGPYLLSCGDP